MARSSRKPVICATYGTALPLIALAACLGATGCAQNPPHASHAAAVTDSDEGPANTRFDPRAYYEKRALYVIDGVASYYGEEFAGRSTANGERYDPDAYTAAHRTLPFGTILRVTRRKTGDWVLVRINDRGPYGRRKRILDLSKQAARRLNMLHDGVAKVRAEVLEVGR